MDGAVDITALIAPGFGPNNKHADAARVLYQQCKERNYALLALPANISAALRNCLTSLASLSASGALERTLPEAPGVTFHRNGDEVGLELREGGSKMSEVWAAATNRVRHRIRTSSLTLLPRCCRIACPSLLLGSVRPPSRPATVSQRRCGRASIPRPHGPFTCGATIATPLRPAYRRADTVFPCYNAFCRRRAAGVLSA